MKLKQFLCLLAIAPFIFFSCEDKEGDKEIEKEIEKEKEVEKDYRDVYEGTYATDIVGSIILADIGLFFPMDANYDITVKKLGSEELILNIDGENMIVTVDNNGDFIVPTESDIIQIDPETGVRLTINLTSSGFGTITDKTLYFKETVSGNAVWEITGEEDVHSDVSGTIVYYGNKK